MEKTFDERYANLNAAQKKAVDTIEGPLLVVAGPGSGKTEILSLRVARILKETQALPSNILCLTFTESAALNMRERLARLMGQEAYRVAIHTFHNFCVNIIQKYPEFFYAGAFFTAADPLAQIAILEDIFETLTFDDPLASIHPEQGYVYLSAVSKAISNLKKGGFLPQEFKEIIDRNDKEIIKINEILEPVFSKTLSKKLFGEIEDAVKKLAMLGEGARDPSLPALPIHDLSEVVAQSLNIALQDAKEHDETKPLSRWKEKMMKRADDSSRVFKDATGSTKMHSLAKIYEKYREVMHAKGLYDFDDMILDTITAIEKNPRLKYELQEQYQYILVDEFQDTNDAQMRLLRLLADAPVNEGRPNLMVVGDDDQAVYKFQGAELSNILDFKRLYTDVGLVTMTANYRSTQDILDIASEIIRKGDNRLEKILPEMEKTLIASHPDLKKDASSGSSKIKGKIVHKTFPSSLHELHFVSREIRKLIDAGHDPEEIAVIARKHKQLESIVPYMQGAGVPIRYEREQNVFQEPHIHQLIVMSRFVESINNHDRSEADDLLPEILCYPFWNLPRKSVWQISVEAGKTGATWLQIMSGSGDKRVRAVAELLLELGVKAAHEPLEKMLDMMIGAHVVLAAESEDEDDEEELRTHFGTSRQHASASREYVSPFKEYYFSKERFDHARSEYLSFLSSLRVFVRALREYFGRHTPGSVLLLRDLIEFVDLHQKNNLSLNDKSPFGSVSGSVDLLSAHKAKGLEFETVFVLSCQDDVWAGRGMGNKLPFPQNLQIEPAGDNEDDQLRIFYVALTRAKHNLYLTSYDAEDNGEVSAKLRFLLPDEEDTSAVKTEALRRLQKGVIGDGEENAKPSAENLGDAEQVPEAHELLTASWLRYHTPPFLGEEKKLLESLLENYQLSVTHLNNFLNVTKGGPQVFLEQNLLRFPQAKTPSGSFGSAIHRTLEKVSVELRREGKLPDESELLSWFTEYLRRERLSGSDMKTYLERGLKALKIFYAEKSSTFANTDKTEVNFKDQGVILDEAHLTGKIDRIVDKAAGVFEVHDYKTGKAKESFDGKDVYEKIKLHEYERQLIFYKILVENSRDFKDRYKVERGVLEFVEPMKGERVIDLPLDITKDQVERVKKLADAVYKKIMALDLPDTSEYETTLSGIQSFEDDLLK